MQIDEFNIKVSVGDKNSDFKSLGECFKKLESMIISDKKIEIELTSEKYFEQVIVSLPNVHIYAGKNVNPKISFYYGIGYKYSNISEFGYYSEEKQDKKHFAKKWGASFIVEDSAINFRATGINFENSFNLFMTREEIEVGVEKISSEEYGQSKCETNEERLSMNVDVGVLKNKERAAALVCEADNSIFENCMFISSQDTLYAGRGRQVYRNCTIIGNVDYIFGEESARASFINCKLKWLGYTGTKTMPGIICAPKGEFIFYKCRIISNKDKRYKVEAGYLARPWRASGAVLFYACEIEKGAILLEGFTSMDGVEPEEVGFFEKYNTYAGKRFKTIRGKEF